MRAIGLIAAMIAIPSPAPAQRPADSAGSLISAEPVASGVADAKAWRIRYWTRDDKGRARQATGMVVAPAAPFREARDVLAWTHGTWGIAGDCSPSASPNFWKQTAGLAALKRGMAVVAPDYIGLGGGGAAHPFLVGEATGRAVLDAVRAARSVEGASAGKRFAVWGESQGGHAALWTAQVQPGYAPDLDLVGAAAAAPPTDLAANLRQAPNAATRAFFTAYIGASWSAHYGVPLSSIAGPVSRGLIGRLAKKCVSLDSKPKLLTVAGIATLQHNLRKVDLPAIRPWSTLAATNSPQVRAFTAPLLISQNPKDDLVAPAVTRAYARRLCKAGQAVRWIDIKGGGHATSAFDSTAATMTWIADRFAAKAAPDDCGRI